MSTWQVIHIIEIVYLMASKLFFFYCLDFKWLARNVSSLFSTQVKHLHILIGKSSIISFQFEDIYNFQMCIWTRLRTAKCCYSSFRQKIIDTCNICVFVVFIKFWIHTWLKIIISMVNQCKLQNVSEMPMKPVCVDPNDPTGIPYISGQTLREGCNMWYV